MAVAGAEPYLPERTDLESLRSAIPACRGCDLYRDATKAVFGEGPPGARAILVGEQPGDKEDLAGEPFVGPAGKLLDRALEAAGIDRSSVYLTNAVKHFKFERRERGKTRIHKKPGRTEIVACTPWLHAEVEAVHPDLLVCLGATAAQAVLGTSFRLTHHRGELVHADTGPFAGARAVATVHPSAVLRAPDRAEAFDALVNDLTTVADLLGGQRKEPK